MTLNGAGPISPEFPGLFRCSAGALNDRDEFASDPSRSGQESLSGGFRGFTFFVGLIAHRGRATE